MTYWPDDIPYLEIPATGIIGYRQVRRHGGLLATMDQALAAVQPGTTLLA
jgi:hypothetical protein